MVSAHSDTPQAPESPLSNCVAPYLEGFASYLAEAACSRKTIVTYVSMSKHLGRWCDRQGIDITSWDDDLFLRFRSHLNQCTCKAGSKGVFRSAKPAFKFLLAYLRTRGVVAPPQPQRYPASTPEIVRQFGSWMMRNRGTTLQTILAYGLSLAPFVVALGADPRCYEVQAIRNFVIRQVGERGHDGTNRMAVAIRAFLRYAVAEGMLRRGIESCIPHVPRYRLSSLPRYISPAEVERVIRSCDRSTAHGLRDRAILLLLARLGLRSGDIMRLRLGDVDWQRGNLRVLGKGRREAELPLPQDVGNALLRYLERGRPSSRSDHIFLTVAAPIRPFTTPMTVSSIVRDALKRAGIHDPPSHGAHLLRHSAATAMLRAGGSLDTIATVLRHKSIDSTMIYAKVDVGALRRIAQRWPGGRLSGNRSSSKSASSNTKRVVAAARVALPWPGDQSP